MVRPLQSTLHFGFPSRLHHGGHLRRVAAKLRVCELLTASGISSVSFHSVCSFLCCRSAHFSTAYARSPPRPSRRPIFYGLLSLLSSQHSSRRPYAYPSPFTRLVGRPSLAFSAHIFERNCLVGYFSSLSVSTLLLFDSLSSSMILSSVRRGILRLCAFSTASRAIFFGGFLNNLSLSLFRQGTSSHPLLKNCFFIGRQPSSSLPARYFFFIGRQGICSIAVSPFPAAFGISFSCL